METGIDSGNKSPDKTSTSSAYYDIVPHVLIFGGILIMYFGFGIGGVMIGVGIIAYAGFGLAHSFKRRYHANFSLQLIKPVMESLILFFGIYYFVFGLYHMVFLLLMVFDMLILTRSRVDGFGQPGKK
jgi:hypothetical protein